MFSQEGRSKEYQSRGPQGQRSWEQLPEDIHLPDPERRPTDAATRAGRAHPGHTASLQLSGTGDRGRICPATAARSQLCSAAPAGAENPCHERILQNHLRTCPRHLPGNRRPPGTSRSTALLQQLLCVGCPHTGWPEPGASGQAEPLTGSLQVQENSAVQAEHGAVLPIKRISLLKRKRLGKGPAPGSVEMCQPLLWHQGRHLGGCI